MTADEMRDAGEEIDALSRDAQPLRRVMECARRTSRSMIARPIVSWSTGGAAERLDNGASTASSRSAPRAARGRWSYDNAGHPDARDTPMCAAFGVGAMVRALRKRGTASSRSISHGTRPIETFYCGVRPRAGTTWRETPLNLAAYRSRPLRARPSCVPTRAVFPGSAAPVGGASLNALLRRTMLERDWPVQCHCEANDESCGGLRAARADRCRDGLTATHAMRLMTIWARRSHASRSFAIRASIALHYEYNTLVHPESFRFAALDEFRALRAPYATRRPRRSCAVLASKPHDLVAGELYASARDEELRHDVLVGSPRRSRRRSSCYVSSAAKTNTIGMWLEGALSSVWRRPSPMSATTRR